MKILQVHTRYRLKGGEDEVVKAEAKVLREAGHNVLQVLEDNPDGDLGAVGSILLSPWNPAATRRMRQAVEAFQPDVAHVHNTWYRMSPAVIRALKKSGVPVVMTLHNYRLTCANGLLYRDGRPCEMCVGSHPWHAVRYSCYRGSRSASLAAAGTIDLHQRLGTWADQVDVFIVLTEFQRDLMIRAGLPPFKLVVNPNFRTDPGPRQGQPSASNMVLYVGRLSEEKGVHILLEAWREAAPPQLELVLVGDGPLRERLEQSLPARARMVGGLPQAEIPRMMLKARAGVMPSVWYEGMPLSMIEFLAAGVPVVVSDVGSPAQVITACLGPRWTFRSADPGSLTETLRELGNGSWCDTSGELARRTFELQLSESRAAERLVTIYRSFETDEGKFQEGRRGRPKPGSTD